MCFFRFVGSQIAMIAPWGDTPNISVVPKMEVSSPIQAVWIRLMYGKTHPQNSLIMFSTSILGTWNSVIGMYKLFVLWKNDFYQRYSKQTYDPLGHPEFPLLSKNPATLHLGDTKKTLHFVLTKMQKEKVTQTYSPKWWLASWWWIPWCNP